MTHTEFFHIDVICTNYRIERAFVNQIYESGLIELQFEQEQPYIHQAQLLRLEKVMNMNEKLDINLPGIEVIMDLLERIEQLEMELAEVRQLR